jgi:pentatricopeptide repeat protein
MLNIDGDDLTSNRLTYFTISLWLGMSSKTWLSLFQNNPDRGAISEFSSQSIHSSAKNRSTPLDTDGDKHSSPSANGKGEVEKRVARAFFDSNSQNNISTNNEMAMIIRSWLLKNPPEENQSIHGVELLNDRCVLDIQHGIKILGTCGPNPHICFALIKRASDWESVKTFYSIIPSNMKNQYVCSAYVKRAAEKDFVAFNDAYETNASKVKDLVLLNIFINGFGKWRKLEKVFNLFNEAKKSYCVDSYSYASVIDACGKAGMMKKAIEVFEEARNKGLLDSVIYTSYIDACQKSGEMEKAMQAFEEAKRRDLVDVKTFNSLINGALKNRNFPIARSLFNEAVQKKIANKVTHSIMIDGCVWENQIGAAIEILKTAPDLPAITKHKNSIANQVDFHGFAPGVGIAYILNNVENIPFVMVVGIGNQGNNETYSFQNSLIGYFKKNPAISVLKSNIPGSVLVVKRPQHNQ